MIVGRISAVIVDEVHGFVYWSENYVSKVKRVRFDGTNQSDIYNYRKLCCVTSDGVVCYYNTLSSVNKHYWG